MFKTYTIKGYGWSADIAPELGANVTRLKYLDRDILVPLESLSQLSDNPYIQGIPLLFPANRTAGGRFTFEGKAYTLPITEPKTGANLHGLLHRQVFKTEELKDNSITLSFTNTDEIYPFPFKITAIYSADPEGFRQRFIIKNTGTGNMPFTFALHTTFAEPESFTVPIDACQSKDENYIPIGGYFPLSRQEARYVTGSPSKGIIASGYYRSCGATATVGDVTYTAFGGADHWILFNGAGKKGLLCVEPQWGAVNGLNTENGHKLLRPNEEAELSTLIALAHK